MSNQARVAIATCAKLIDLDPDDRPLLGALAMEGLAVSVHAWDDPAADWGGYDLVLIRSTWDYVPRQREFIEWAASVPRLANTADVVAWNTDKRYLAELAAAGVPTVATEWISSADSWAAPTDGEWVVKPTISAGSKDTGRYRLDEAGHRALAMAHVARLQAAGRLVMVQRYLPSVDERGETAVIFLDGEFSHAIRKGAILVGPDHGVDGLYAPEDIGPREPSEEELAVARQAIAAVPPALRDGLLYARVDVVQGVEGSAQVIELELTEPSLFFRFGPGSLQRMARAVARRVAAAA